jgi:uncharacterized membrane protein
MPPDNEDMNPAVRVDPLTGERLSGTPERDAARGGVLFFIVSGYRALNDFVRQRRTDSGAESVGIVDDEGPVRTATAVVTIRRSVDEVYAFVRDVENWPQFMGHLDSVEPRGLKRFRWRWHMRIVGGQSFELDAEIIEERPGELLVWSLPDAGVDNRVTMHLSPALGDRGTEVHVDVRYAAPAGGLGVLTARLLGFDPGHQASGDLDRLKQVLETGAVVHSDASIHPTVHPAQPPTKEYLQQHSLGEDA